MSLPTPLRFTPADLLRTTPQGIRALLQVCQPAGTQQESQPRPSPKPSVNQRRREGR